LEFEAWLSADGKNRDAWDRIQQPWNLLGEHATAPELLALRTRALERVHNVSRKRWTGRLSSGSWSRAAWAATLVVVGLIGLISWSFNRSIIYRTDTGERRTVTLTDGSQIQLDALTELRVSYSAGARDLQLVKGQARFDVARDPRRPFSVLAMGRRVVAVGTAFNVDLLGRDMLVTLIEGKVMVLAKDTVPQETGDSARGSRYDGATSQTVRSTETDERVSDPIELSPGQQLRVSNGKVNLEKGDLARATAWQSGQLVFDDELLSSVVTRINRYSERHLVLRDAETAAVRISGVFRTGDIDGFVSTITHYLPITAKENRGSILLSLEGQSPVSRVPVEHGS